MSPKPKPAPASPSNPSHSSHPLHPLHPSDSSHPFTSKTPIPAFAHRTPNQLHAATYARKRR